MGNNIKKNQLKKMYDRLLKNCDTAIANSNNSWATEFWTSTKQKLYTNMSKHGILKDHKSLN